ncbi:MAG TPA: hypothetical protein VGF22_19190 [Acidimicrobiales bacterium]|jgi:hypothetical protein
MSAPSPWDRPPLDEPEVDPAGRRRRAAVTAGLVVGAVVLAIVVFMAAGRSDGDNPALARLRPSTTTTTTTPAASTTTSPVTSGASPTAVAPIHVDVAVGTVVIAGHMACSHEADVTGDTLADLEAAVAADYNGTASGGTTKPYAHDAAAQSEIVRASVQQLHTTQRFYADCRPVSTTSQSGSQPASGTEPPAATDTGTPSASTPSLPPSR